MLGWAIVFFVMAIVTAAFGYGGIATGIAGVAKVMFIVFLVLLALSIIMHMVRRPPPPPPPSAL